MESSNSRGQQPIMNNQESNGKTTAGLVVQIAAIVVAIIAAVSAPLILMYSKLNSMEVEFNKKFDEVESQFRAADALRNVNLAGQMRFNALLWQKTYGDTFPSDVYFPEISNHSNR